MVNHVDVLSLAGGLIAEFDKSQAGNKVFPPDVFINLRGIGKTINTGNDLRGDSVIFIDKPFAVRLKDKPIVAEVPERRKLIAIVRFTETVADRSGNETATFYAVAFIIALYIRRLEPLHSDKMIGCYLKHSHSWTSVLCVHVKMNWTALAILSYCFFVSVFALATDVFSTLHSLYFPASHRY